MRWFQNGGTGVGGGAAATATTGGGAVTKGDGEEDVMGAGTLVGCASNSRNGTTAAAGHDSGVWMVGAGAGADTGIEVEVEGR